MQISLFLIGGAIGFAVSLTKAAKSVALIGKIPQQGKEFSDVALLLIRLEQEGKANPLLESAYAWMTLTAILLFLHILFSVIGKGGVP